MSYHLLSESAAPSTPAAGKVALYFDSAPDPNLRLLDDAGRNIAVNPITNASVTAQTPAAATRTYLAGSALRVPPSLLRVGACFRWKLSVTKTAAGTASSTYDVCVGTNGTTADTARLSFTKPAGTADADEGVIEIMMTIRSIGATGVAVGEFTLMHNLAATGHATIPCVCDNDVSAGFDMTVANLIVGVCVTSGAADALTFEMVQAQAFNL